MRSGKTWSPWNSIDQRIEDQEKRLLMLSVTVRVLSAALERQIGAPAVEDLTREVGDAITKTMNENPERNPIDLILGVPE